MHIVIDIPDSLYKDIKENEIIAVMDREEVAEIILKAVVLPKKHGRLIDGDYLYDKFKANGIENIENGYLALQFIKDEPTVLDADGGMENGII